MRKVYLVMVCRGLPDVRVHDGERDVYDRQAYDAQVIAQHEVAGPVDVVYEKGAALHLQIKQADTSFPDLPPGML